MSVRTSKLPHWDVSVLYPSLESAEFAQGFAACIADIQSLSALFDELDISRQDARPLHDKAVSVVESVLERFGAVSEAANTMRAYITSFVSTDSRNDLALARMSEFQNQALTLSLLWTRFAAWLGGLDVEALIARSPRAAEHAFLLLRTREQATHLMSPAEEELAATLSLSGGSAWAKLHRIYSSQLSVPVQQEAGGPLVDVPMSAARNLAYHPVRGVRQTAYQNELAAWEQAAVPLAACMNGVKGEVNTLTGRRGWSSALEQSLFDNGIDGETLDAMMTAAFDAFPIFRRYLRAKAQMLGLDALTWYDLFAPVVSNGHEWSYDEATNFILEQFQTYSPRMGGLARRAFAEGWVDAEPRSGKSDGAFCMRLRGDESRILSNFKPSYSGLSTLAHELGHAYHGHVIAVQPPLLRRYPMTLAETASIFCETIVRRAALAVVDAQEQVNILEASLMGACQIVVDISSRYLFEKSVFAKRGPRELAAAELNELMLDAQRQTYGDGLDQAVMHPYMWAVKPHYYSADRSFYNYPYMFGLLFGLGLYAHFLDDGDAFRAQYDDLLASTGTVSAHELASRFGIDIRSQDFWQSSLDVIREDVDKFETLASSR